MEKPKKLKNIRAIRDYGTSAVEIKLNFQFSFFLFMEIENLKKVHNNVSNDWLLSKFADMLGEQFGFCEPDNLQNYFAPENED